MARNLTEIERHALQANRINLADGHARQSLPVEVNDGLSELVFRHLHSRGDDTYTEVERHFLEALAVRTGQRYPQENTFVTYSSSIAIDMVAKLIARSGRRTGLVAPTFDNIPALFRLAGVEPVAIPEHRLMPTCDLDYLSRMGLQALFLVNPNNPTGAVLDRDSMTDLFAWAARRGVLLIFDMAFRLYDDRTCHDLGELATAHEATVMTIDDTGKILPLRDTKLGVLSAFGEAVAEIGYIHSEVLLGVSTIDLVLLTHLLGVEGYDVVASARDLVQANRDRLKSEPALLSGIEGSDVMSVAWLRMGSSRSVILEHCQAHGVELLPGDKFFWAEGAGSGEEYLRVALIRDHRYFRTGLETFAEAATSLHAPRPSRERI